MHEILINPHLILISLHSLAGPHYQKVVQYM